MDISSDRDVAVRPSGGRRRHPEGDRRQKITATVLRTVFEQGLGGVTMEGVARRAGVAKTTIYRRWPNREAMVIEALSTIYSEFKQPNTGHVRTDLKAVAREAASSELLTIGGIGGIAHLIASAANDRRYWDVAMGSWDRLVRQLLVLGQERGQIRGDVDVALAADLLHGAFVFRALDQTRPVTETFMDEVVDAVLDGIGSR